MALLLLLCNRRRLQLPLLLAILFAASRGDSSSSDYNTTICKLQPYICGSMDIHYPFYLSDETADVLGNKSSSCGYPGLAIDCVDGQYPTLQLGSGPYSYNVTRIDYPSSPISLANPNVLGDGDGGCRVDHNVTVPSTVWLTLPPEYSHASSECHDRA